MLNKIKKKKARKQYSRTGHQHEFFMRFDYLGVCKFWGLIFMVNSPVFIHKPYPSNENPSSATPHLQIFEDPSPGLHE